MVAPLPPAALATVWAPPAVTPGTKSKMKAESGGRRPIAGLVANPDRDAALAASGPSRTPELASVLCVSNCDSDRPSGCASLCVVGSAIAKLRATANEDA